jgi:hypothetical protein
MSRAKARSGARTVSRGRQRGQEIIEFAFVALLFVPMFLGMFVTGRNLIISIQANNTVRSLGNMYIHGADFSTYPYQQLAQRMGTGLNLQMPSFSGNLQSNTGSTGDGIIRITEVMYVGKTTDPNCVAVGAGSCTNHDSFVFIQRIVFGNSALATPHPSSMGDPTGATISMQGSVSNYVTDTNAKLPSAGQAAMVALWQTTANGQQPLTDGQVFYAAEGYFQTPSFSLGNNVSQGVSVRSFF